MLNRFFKFFPVAAALLIAAAFVIMCFNAPVYADTTTGTVYNDYFNSMITHYGLQNQDAQSAAFVAVSRYGEVRCRIYLGLYETGNTSSYVSYGCSYCREMRVSGGNYTYNTPSNIDLSFYDNYVFVGGDTYSYGGQGTSGRYVIGITMPVTADNRPVERMRTLRNYSLNNGTYSFTGVTPVLDTPMSVKSYYDNYASPSVVEGQTTTTTTTTSTSTTSTTVTLPPYPYQTSPPFELPSDWTADYSETTPIPSVPPFTTAVIKDVDDALDGADSSFIGAIGFWFLVLGEILNDYPLLVYMIVFTIAILLLVGLLYNGGGDDK